MSAQDSRERDKRDAQVLSKHIPEGYSAGPEIFSHDGENISTITPNASAADNPQASSLRLQGGDVHRALFKINARAKQPQRAATFSSPTTRSLFDEPADEEPPAVVEQSIPGGFRRHFLQAHRRISMSSQLPGNFVEFLAIYGNFAGEDLHDNDDDSIAVADDAEGEEQQDGERRPLLPKRSSTAVGSTAKASVVKSFFTLLKAFIGTGILFLPKAFNNGGILFASITLVTVSLVSTFCFHLLLRCKKEFGGSYGDIAEQIAGSKMRKLVLFSIFISQIGFVCTGFIFAAENIHSFLGAVYGSPTPLSPKALIAMQVLVIIPLAWIRNVSKLGPAALFADCCILFGLSYIYTYDFSSLARNGLDKSVVLFNRNHYTLTIGSAIFTFEGIGLILPIQSSMKQPEKFNALLYTVMLIITIIFTSVGFLSYATFGSSTRTEVISNFPQDQAIVNAVQFLYSLAVLVGNPVQLFPAVRIIEGYFFPASSTKASLARKWKKNLGRAFIVMMCALISILGANDLDRFVALIGSFACIPLVYIYPAFLHYRGFTPTRFSAFFDLALMFLGAAAMAYTTGITISTWGQ